MRNATIIPVGLCCALMAMAVPVMILSCEDEPPPVREEPEFMVGGDISLLDKIRTVYMPMPIP